MSERLIVTNGDSTAEALRAAGMAAEILPWRDMLHDGPVPQGLSLEALSEVRARYLAEAFAIGHAEVGSEFAARDATIRNHAKFDRIELWFEHDLYDQLQLIQVLDVLSGLGRSHGLFFLPAALHRLIAELPDVRSGLSLTEERILSTLSDGACAVGPAFKATVDQEDACFLGDTPFFRRLDALTFCPTPLISGLPFPSQRCAQGPSHPDYRAFTQSTITLTEAGRAALAGRFDHARENGVDRWLGGTHLTPQNLWRRKHDGVVVAPPVQ